MVDAPLGTGCLALSDDEGLGELPMHAVSMSIETTRSPASEEPRSPLLWAPNPADDDRAKLAIRTPFLLVDVLPPNHFE